MSDFKRRILEMHSVHAWDFRLVMRAMDFARNHGMNAMSLASQCSRTASDDRLVRL